MPGKVFKFVLCKQNNYPTKISIMSSNEKLKCHKVPYVLKGHVPNKYTHPFPFRDENALKIIL